MHRGADRLLDADLLVGAAAHHRVFRNGWAGRRSRAASRCSIFRAATGFMLIDSLLSGQEGAFGRPWPPDPARPIVLATIPLAVIARQTRSAMLEVLGEDYIRTARAKGLRRRVVGLHALRNALIPVITVIGLSGRHAAGRRDPDRDDLFLAGHRQVDGRLASSAATIRGAGWAAADRDHRDGRQSDGRCALRLINPQDQERDDRPQSPRPPPITGGRTGRGRCANSGPISARTAAR